MSDVSFNEEQDLTHRYASASTKKGGIAGLVIRMGFAKTESQANMVMIGVVVVAFVIMAFIWMPHGSSHPKSTALPPAGMVPGAAPAP